MQTRWLPIATFLCFELIGCGKSSFVHRRMLDAHPPIDFDSAFVQSDGIDGRITADLAETVGMAIDTGFPNDQNVDSEIQDAKEDRDASLIEKLDASDDTIRTSDVGSEMNNSASCGMPNQSCCPGNSCAGGGCCMPRPPSIGLFCTRPGDTCEGGTGICGGGSCGHCGGIGQPCCNGQCTAPGSKCIVSPDGSRCVTCGGLGEPCCSGVPGYPDRCIAVGLGCSLAGKCQPCGKEGQTCCDGANACPAEMVCNPSQITCERCGALGQFCCGGQCANGSACDQANNRCAPCGLLGELCCPGSVCITPRSICYPNVTLEFSPEPSLCRACGELGQNCCASRTCQSNFTCTGSDIGTCIRS